MKITIYSVIISIVLILLGIIAIPVLRDITFSLFVIPVGIANLYNTFFHVG